MPAYKQRLRRRSSRMLTIPMYHGVVSEPAPVFNWCQLELPRFEEQMAFVAQEYRVIPLREVVDRIYRGQVLPERAAVITFDDGLRSVYTHAFPVLARYQLPFTVFLVTSLVGKDQQIWTNCLFSAMARAHVRSIGFAGRTFPLVSSRDRATAYNIIVQQLKRMEDSAKVTSLDTLLTDLGDVPAADPALALMNWEEIGKLSQCGLADFGSHTHTHPILSRCDALRQRSELEQSRNILLQHFEVADLFAYPNGTRDDFDGVTKKLVAECGYRCAVSTVPGLNRPDADIYEFRRVNIGSDSSFAEFERSLLGI